MGYFKVRYDSRVVIYDRKMFIRLATGSFTAHGTRQQSRESVEIVISFGWNLAKLQKQKLPLKCSSSIDASTIERDIPLK